ncbi:MAG: putative integral rane protein [Gemmatimonadetes bacterium]|nr:putative integral rane protein [Gemmatimonadota bacterium]
MPSNTLRRNDEDHSKLSAALWAVQVLLALIFVFAGGMKLVMPIAAMTKEMALPGAFLRFIGVCELAGGLGLIFPALLRVRPYLTPAAAGGLVIIMSGAIGISMAGAGGSIKPALAPFVVGLFCAFVAYGRARIAPIAEKTRGSARHAATALQPAS